MSVIPRRAIIIIDVQNEYVTGKLRIEYPPLKQSLENIAQLMNFAHANDIPVVVVQQTSPEGSPVFERNSAGWQLHKSVMQLPHDHYVEKRLPSAFAGTDLADWLTQQQIDTVTIAGYMTHNCDDATIKDAMHQGFAVEFISDATGSLPYANDAGAASAEEIHRVLSVVMHSRFAAVITTAKWFEAAQNGIPIKGDNILASYTRALNS